MLVAVRSEWFLDFSVLVVIIGMGQQHRTLNVQRYTFVQIWNAELPSEVIRVDVEEDEYGGSIFNFVQYFGVLVKVLSGSLVVTTFW